MDLAEKSPFPSPLTEKVNPAPERGRGEPSLWEVILIFAGVSFLHLLTVCRVRSFWDVSARSFDNGPYLQIATIIRNWHSTGEAVPRHFWGFPFAIAAISKLFAMPELVALVMISSLGSLIACLLTDRLYGGLVAAAFIFINYKWIQLSVEGGSEPLFICLLLAALLAARSERWNLAALLAALGTTVRPVGIFALVAFAAVLGLRKSYRQLTVITLIGLAIGALYVGSLWLIVRSPFVNFIGYRGDWGSHGPITFPFVTLLPSFLECERWTVTIYSAVWLVFAAIGIVTIWLPRNRQRFLATFQSEVLFASLVLIFFVSYNSVEFVAAQLPRFLIPVAPMLLFALRDWIPRERWVLWGAAALSGLMASANMVGFRYVFGFRLP